MPLAVPRSPNDRFWPLFAVGVRFDALLDRTVRNFSRSTAPVVGSVRSRPSMRGGAAPPGLAAGAGWMKEEFELLGAPFEDRGRLMDENLAAALPWRPWPRRQNPI
jgi:hypothetical protein